jgi:DNA-directed RNA polymerase specialized sigma24 family protein
MPLEHDQRISELVTREQFRLRNFIRRRVPDPGDVEDILQDVFYQLVEANRLLMPIDHVTGWLFRVARNRITDLFRKKKPESFSNLAVVDDDNELLRLEDLLPSPDAGRMRFTPGAYFWMNWKRRLTNCPKSSARCLLRTNSKGLASRRWPPRAA